MNAVVELPLPEAGQDKRTAPRHRVLGHAQIIGRTGATNCVVRDLSESGAKLGVSGKVKVPPEFDLWFVQRKLKLRVRVKWRNGEHLGVAFINPQQVFKVRRPSGERYVVDV
jgi:hypothetical protein